MLIEMDILKKYNIRFFKKEIYGSTFYGINTVNPLLDQFITEDQTFEDALETIDALESVINGEIGEINYSGQSLITLVSNANVSTIYDDPQFTSTSPQYSLPTADLKIIMKVWTEYLQQ